MWLQQNPIVVDLGTQPAPARDISIDIVLGIFALAGAFLAAAAIGSALVAGGMVLYKRRKDAANPNMGPSHTQLGL
jgi:predicted phage tail protein